MRLPIDEDKALHPTSKTGDNTFRQDRRWDWTQLVQQVQKKGLEADFAALLDEYIADVEAMAPEPSQNVQFHLMRRSNQLAQQIAKAGKTK